MFDAPGSSKGRGVRRETSHQQRREGEEQTRVNRAQPRLVLKAEQGAGVWVWVTPPAPDPLLSGVLGGRTVQAGVVNNPMCPVCSC